MKTTRLFAVLFLLLFSCQTTMKAPEVTQRALELASFRLEKNKLALKRYFLSQNNKAFALNPMNKNYSWSYRNLDIGTAKAQALSNCGSGCELFAVNDKIVWPYQGKEIFNNAQSSVATTSQSETQKPESVTFQYQNYQQQPITTQSTTQPKVVTQQNWQNYSYTPPSSQLSAQPKPSEPKNQPTTQLTQTAQQQIQQLQPIQQQQQTTVYAKPQLADRRIALVIGNEKYINAPLENPVNDSRAVGNVLKRLGFKTLQYENLGQKEMKRAIDDFGHQLKNYDIGLFFYSGHGTQIKGENYLIPIDAAPKSENEVDYDCLPAGRVLAKMEDSGSVTNIIILDACRNNPFERSWSRSSQSKGLVFMNAPSGSLIAYSTSPGKIAFDKSSQKNSPYTAALLKHIETPNISIVQMFQRVRVTVEHETGKEQTPWESTSLRDDFYFYRANGQ